MLQSGANQATQAAGPQLNEVPAVMNSLDMAIDNIGKTIDEMFIKIEPVMSMPSENKVDGQPLPSKSSALASRLQDFQWRINYINNRVRTMTDLIQL